MNSFFASVEQQANPFLRGKPIAVTGKKFDAREAHKPQRSIVAAASVEAKKLGVKTAMPTSEAKRICPNLIFVPGDPEKYSNITHKMNDVFREVTGLVEPASVDESFLDVTAQAEDYMGAIILAQHIRARLKEVCGEHISVSIGVGPNKLIAKLGSGSEKPNGLTVVYPHQVLEFMDKQDLSEIYGIGRRILKRLHSLGIETVTELRMTSLSKLVKEFKSYGVWLYRASRGDGDIIVNPDPEAPKSIGHSYTFPHDLESKTDIRRALLTLADKVAFRMRRDGFSATAVSVRLRYSDLSSRVFQKRFNEREINGKTLMEIAWRLCEPYANAPIRLVGISAHRLSTELPEQDLFSTKHRELSFLGALDKIQNKFGKHAWRRASLMNTWLKARSSGWHYDHEL